MSTIMLKTSSDQPNGSVDVGGYRDRINVTFWNADISSYFSTSFSADTAKELALNLLTAIVEAKAKADADDEKRAKKSKREDEAA